MARDSQWGVTRSVEMMSPRQKSRLFNVGLGVTMTPLWMLPLLLLCEVRLDWLWIVVLGLMVFAGLFMMMPGQTLRFMEAIGALVAKLPIPFTGKRNG